MSFSYVVCHRDESMKMSRLEDKSGQIRAKWESANLTLNSLKMNSFGDKLEVTNDSNGAMCNLCKTHNLGTMGIKVNYELFRFYFIIFDYFDAFRVCYVKEASALWWKQPNIDEKQETRWMKTHIHSLTVDGA